ncbi:hypothetical protein ACOXXX_02540 [Thalassococcus sp. BH17M4-6]|uniref:hypothetical protein n=1 Tax=Thalassococcus sp. BH17M4-6 TaxID=3413148 RepID=UPI003BEC54AD
MPPQPRARTGDGLIPAVRGEGMLFDDPRPLVFADLPVVVSWSPKSACTHVLTWFLAQEGLVDAAAYFDPWPHEFRGKVYYRSRSYRVAATRLLDSGGAGHTMIRITRAPQKRLVSIFRHALRTGFLRADLDAALGRDTAATGVSLREFGAHLRGQALVTPSAANVHLRAQYHPVWDLAFDRVITLNMDESDLDAGLAAIEGDLGLPHRRPADFAYFRAVKDRHYSRDMPWTASGPVEEARLGAESGADFPKSALERTALAIELAQELHAVDMGRVATGDSAGRLFR